MLTCPRCKMTVSADDSQCQNCGENLRPHGRKSQGADPTGNPYPSEDAEAAAVLNSLPHHMKLSPLAAWGMFACLLIAGLSTAYAFWSHNGIFIVVAIIAVGLIFAIKGSRMQGHGPRLNMKNTTGLASDKSPGNRHQS